MTRPVRPQYDGGPISDVVITNHLQYSAEYYGWTIDQRRARELAGTVHGLIKQHGNYRHDQGFRQGRDHERRERAALVEPVGDVPPELRQILDDLGRTLGTALLAAGELSSMIGARGPGIAEPDWDERPPAHQKVIELYSQVHTAQKALARALGAEE